MTAQTTKKADSDADSYDIPEDDFEKLDFDSDDEDQQKAATKLQAQYRGRMGRRAALKKQETQYNAAINERDKTIGQVRKMVEENLAIRRELMSSLSSSNISVPGTIEAQRLLSVVALDTEQLPKLVAVFEKVKAERELLYKRKMGFK